MPVRRQIFVIFYTSAIVLFFLMLALIFGDIENPALIWVAPVSESLFITGSLILVYVLLSRGLLAGDKFSTAIGLSFLITVIPTLAWLLSWHNVEGQSFISTPLSTHIWLIYLRDFLFLACFLVLIIIASKNLIINIKKTISYILTISLAVSLFIVTPPFLPTLIENNKFFPLNGFVASSLITAYILAIIFLFFLNRKRKILILQSFILFLVIYAEGYLSFIFASGRLDLLWLLGKAVNLFAFGILIASLITEYTGFFIDSFVARSVEKGFKPNIPELDWLEISAHYKPAVKEAAIGGDWYDVVTLSPERIVLILGDAVGKGIEAISTMTEAKFLLRGYILEGRDIDSSVNSLNNYLCKYLKEDEFITLAIVLIDKNSENMDYVLAGHPPPLIVSGDEWRELHIPDVRLPLGLKPDNAYAVNKSTLKKDDVIVIYSDGVTEARQNGLLFGEENLARFVLMNHDSDPKTINKKLFDFIQGFWKIVDDLTILTAKKTQ